MSETFDRDNTCKCTVQDHHSFVKHRRRSRKRSISCRSLCKGFLCYEGSFENLRNFKELQQFSVASLHTLTSVNNNSIPYDDMNTTSSEEPYNQTHLLESEICSCSEKKQIKHLVPDMIRFHLESLEIQCDFLCIINDKIMKKNEKKLESETFEKKNENSVTTETNMTVININTDRILIFSVVFISIFAVTIICYCLYKHRYDYLTIRYCLCIYQFIS